jgi:hypothetical protein
MIKKGGHMTIEQNKRLLLELYKHRYDVNKKIINDSIEDLNLEKLKPIVEMVAKSRAAYLSELKSMAENQTDKSLNIERLKARREEFTELVKATNALEVAIERGYLDIVGYGET